VERVMVKRVMVERAKLAAVREWAAARPERS
jgi:hypothetical protein